MEHVDTSVFFGIPLQFIVIPILGGTQRGKKKKKEKNIIGLLDNKERCNNNKQTIYVSPLEIAMSFFS